MNGDVKFGEGRRDFASILGMSRSQLDAAVFRRHERFSLGSIILSTFNNIVFADPFLSGGGTITKGG